MTLLEQKEKAKKLLKAEKFDEALPLFTAIWECEKNEWNGYFLAQCLRKSEKYKSAEALLEVLEKNYPHSNPIKHEKLWLNYTTKIKDISNSDYQKDAELILKESDQYNKYTKNLFIKTILAVAHRLSYDEPRQKIAWLNRLDQSILDNKVFRFNNIAYPADRKRYFIQYADGLIALGIHVKYLEEQLSKLHFKGIKHTAFLKYMVNAYTFNNNNQTIISRTKLALYIKNFQEEIHLRKRIDVKSIFKENKRNSVSELSHFLFCPVSFAIHQTYEIYANSSWERDEWKRDKLYLADRLRIYQETGKLANAFDDAQIHFTEEMTKQIHFIFQSEIIVNNVTQTEPTIFESSSGGLLGAPDYILKHPNGMKYIVTEKFSHLSARDNKQPYESDLVKPIAFLNQFKQLELDFGILINWYWDHVDESTENKVRKKIILRSFKSFKILPGQNELHYNRSFESIKKFKNSKMLVMDGDSIAWPAKCLSCSVVSYCHHKTGQFDEILVPYPLLPPSLRNSNYLET